MRSLIRLVLGLAMSALGVSSAARADSTTFYTVTYVEVVPPSAAQGATLLRQYGQTSRKAAGAVRVEVLRRIDRPNQFTVLAVWTEQKAFEAYQAAPSTKELQARLEPLLASPTDQRLHHGLSVDTATAATAAGAVYVVTHVDVIPPRKDDGVAALKQLADDSRTEAGHVRFDVVQQTNRLNHFTVVEVWASRQTFDAHGMAAHTKRFRDQLAPMSGALYDERLYLALD
jgi:quinol monooxygenase YgiN